MIVSLVLLLASLIPAQAAEVNCRSCHPTTLTGLHGALACTACHGATEQAAHTAGPSGAQAACVVCHDQQSPILEQKMATRRAEKDFVAHSYGRRDANFYANNCSSCHLSSCNDCHGSGHNLQRPDTEVCLSCHKGAFVGWDYLGRAPREDSLRYQRGPQAQGEHYLLMRPDIHAERGMTCADCHTMASLAAGQTAAKSCEDCHSPDPDIIEHRIDAHLDKLECSACHSAWSPQEYGSFYLKMVDSPAREYFRVRQDPASDYVKSAYLKTQEAPPLGLNAQGKISPLRPFFMYYSEIVEGEPVGVENQRLLAAWQPFTPHTIRRATPLCDSCHNNPRRFLLEPKEERIYRPDLDGLGIDSFWNRSGQTVMGGAFLPAERVKQLQQKSPAYRRDYVEKWQEFLKHVDSSSASAPR